MRRQKSTSQQFVDRFAKYYTPAIIVIAILVAIYLDCVAGTGAHGSIRGLRYSFVGCPCALVVSTPVAIVTAIGNAASQGVLIKGGIHLEETGRLDVIAFDKTGTLTKGYPEVTDFIVSDEVAQEPLLSAIAAVESMSQHPLAKAVVDYAHQHGAQKVTVSNFQSVTGKGAYAEIDGMTTYIGSLSWSQELSSLPRCNVTASGLPSATREVCHGDCHGY